MKWSDLDKQDLRNLRASGLSEAEIAAALDRSRGAVRSKVYRERLPVLADKVESGAEAEEELRLVELELDRAGRPPKDDGPAAEVGRMARELAGVAEAVRLLLRRVDLGISPEALRLAMSCVFSARRRRVGR